MNTTRLQVGLMALLIVALLTVIAIQRRAGSSLRQENEALRLQTSQIAALTQQNQRLSNAWAKAQQPATQTDEQKRELLKLRGEVGVLRQAATEAAATAKNDVSPLSSMTANPETNKLIRDQQKFGLGMIYKGFGKRANVPEEKMEALSGLLADHVMTNINHITAVLREGKSPEQMDQVFARQEAETNEKIKALLGSEGFTQYQDYNRNLASYLTSEQFKGMLPGDNAAKEAKTKQMYDLMQQETQKALAANGLNPDFQLVPTLNFRNFASEQEGEKNIAILDSVYEQVAAGAESFLSPEELQKFGEFRKLAINNNRLGLSVNRKLMAPPSKSP
jgi:hypothetical protein